MTAALVALAVSIPFVILLVTRPLIRRLALRNAGRRLVELGLVVLGSMLGTAIITGSLVVGDTIDRSIRAIAYEQLGPIDEQIATTDPVVAAEVRDRVLGIDGEVDGTVDFRTAPAAVVHLGAVPASQPRAQLVEVDFEAARAFGGDPAATGIDGPTPTEGEAAVTVDLARRLDVGVGDEVTVFAFGASTTVEIDRVLDRRGIAGVWTIDSRQQSYNLLVAPGTIDGLTGDAAVGEGGVEPPTWWVAVSNVGSVEGGASRTEVVVERLEGLLADLPVRVQPVKQEVLDLAEANAASLSELYFTMGMFAVAAGLLLLVNIFVMLADERRSELGILRALGMRRSPLVASFALEGWLSALAASVVGAFAGIGFGWVISWRADQVLGSGEEIYALDLTFAFRWSTVLTGFALGLTIAAATIVATSVRISRLNVIAAIRDLPRPPRQAAVAWGRRLAPIAVAMGVAATVAGVGGNGYGLMVGPMLVLVGFAPVALRVLTPRVVVLAVAGAVVGWGAASVPVIGALDASSDIAIFLVQGLVMSAAGVAAVTAFQPEIGRALGRITGRRLPVRLGLAYPLARRFRTAMTLGMFAVIVLTLVYISVMSAMFRGRAEQMTNDLGGGFDVVVVSNPTDPVPLDELAATPGVDDVAPVAYAAAGFRFADDPEEGPTTWPISGVGPELLRGPPVLLDRGDHDTDLQAWQAVLDDPGLIIVDEFFLADAGPSDRTPRPGDAITLVELDSGRSRELTVTATATSDYIANGALYGIDGFRELFGDKAVPSRFFVSADEPEQAAEAIARDFLRHGADAATIRELVDSLLALNDGFFALMQQFVAVGLIVSTAGVGVLMVRAVRERRREVGVLRSLGLQPTAVATTFVVEAAFVTVEGVLIGIVVALIATWGLADAESLFAQDLSWTVPVPEVAAIAALSITAALIAAVLPARRASRIRPAVALRIAE